jgi:small subunit ribosomal protein S5
LILKIVLVGVQRVTKVTRGGRGFWFSAIVAGEKQELLVGHSLGKSKDSATAIAKAVED